MGRTQRKPRSFDLLRQVYAELSLQLGHSFSAAELLQAAQTLIDVSRDEYGDTLFKEGRLYPGYYSMAVDDMMRRRSWWVLENERLPGQTSDVPGADEENVRQRLKRFFGPNTYSKRGYW